MLGAWDLLARVIPVRVVTREREAKGIDVELSALRWVGGNDRDACNEFDVHMRTTFCSDRSADDAARPPSSARSRESLCERARYEAGAGRVARRGVVDPIVD